MQTYREAFPNENIYIHMPKDRPPAGEANPQKARYKFCFIWRAITPTGRASKYWHALQTNDPCNMTASNLPRLRKGYRWTGPFLYGKYNTWQDSEA